MKRSKYGNVKTVVDGITFDSKAEARRYAGLRALVANGIISDLELQPSFVIDVNGVKICTYRADFAYQVRDRHDKDDHRQRIDIGQPPRFGEVTYQAQ